MRCPQCGDRFQVLPDGSTRTDGSARTTAGTAEPPSSKKRRMTQVGLGPPEVPSSPPPQLGAGSTPAPLQRPEELDLPAPIATDLEDLPAPRGGRDVFNLDAFGDVTDAIDLPAPTETDLDPFSELDLPAPKEPVESIDLPAPMGSGPAGTVDLPAPRATDSVDLPVPRSSVDLPAPRPAAGVDLPAPAAIDLPAPRGTRPLDDEVDLPMAMTDAELPAPMSLDSELPVPLGQSDLPIPLDQSDLPVARDDFSDPPVPDAGREPGGPVELDLPDGDDLALEMEIDSGPGQPPPPPPAVGGPVGHPETGSPSRVRQDSDELDLLAPDDLEFSELPPIDEPVVERMPHPGRAAKAGAKPRPRKRSVDIRARFSRKPPPWLGKAVAVLAIAVIVLGAGYYPGSTKYGLFGIHLVEPFLPASGDAVHVAQAIHKAESAAASDTYEGNVRALEVLERARADAGLNRALIARSLLHESYFQNRFGRGPKRRSEVDPLRLHLQRRGDEAPAIHVALAANALRQGDPASAATQVALARSQDPSDAYVSYVAGEVALATGDGKEAVEAFGGALDKDGSARAQWGLARAYRLLGDREASLAAAEETRRASPSHAGARVVLGEHAIIQGELDQAYALLEPVAGLSATKGEQPPPVANADRSAALALVAQIEERRGRVGAARELYDRALELDASNTRAALGAARLVLMEGRHQDALARFQTVIAAQLPPDAELDATGQPTALVEAKLGATEALVAMGKAAEAKSLLADLDTEEPVNTDVEIWQGKVADALGDSKQAIRHFRQAIELEPAAFAGYMALSEHYKSTKRPAEAVAVLVEAQNNVDITAEVRRLLGDAELERNNIDAAISEYQAALKMEPRDSSAQFGLAVAYRRKLALDEAADALERVEKLDASYPGLALERGLLAEARNDFDEAAARYSAALEAAPSDIALQSRFGAVLVKTGKLDEAETILREVLRKAPHSADAEHYLGRVAMTRDDLAAARQHFTRATRLDPQNGMYRMYLAWAALESNEMSNALRGLQEALRLDPTLGDAYWLRGRIELRAGSVRDALTDLQKAISLNPNRTEAWADIGESHYQLGQIKEAIAAFQKAVESNPDNGYWWYRIGQLQLDQGKRAPALDALTRSAEIGEAAPEPPPWLADAERLRGDVYYAQRKNRNAIECYGRYLELSPPNAIDRADVKTKLRRIGAVPD